MNNGFLTFAVIVAVCYLAARVMWYGGSKERREERYQEKLATKNRLIEAKQRDLEFYQKEWEKVPKERRDKVLGNRSPYRLVGDDREALHVWTKRESAVDELRQLFVERAQLYQDHSDVL